MGVGGGRTKYNEVTFCASPSYDPLSKKNIANMGLGGKILLTMEVIKKGREFRKV